MKRRKNTVDIAGSISSFLCALHCMAFPLLLSFGVIGSSELGMHDSIETFVLLASTLFAILSIRSTLRHSDRWYLQLFMIMGVVLLFFGFFLMSSFNHAIMAMGGLLLATGHLLNLRLLRLQRA